MGLLEDKLRQSFGFPTKKESLDHQIETYESKSLQSIEYSIASRNIAISYLNEQIRQLEEIIKDNQFFIDAYNTIKDKATEKLNDGNNPERIRLCDSKGNVIIEGNYQTIKSYQASLLKKNISPKSISTYTNMLGLAYEKLWQSYAEKIIEGKGLYFKSGKDIDECYEIYTAYVQSINLMKANRMKSENRTPVTISSTNMSFINAAYNFCMNANSILRLALQELQLNLEKLNSEQATDEYAKSIIENTKKMMATTAEYFRAKKSQEYLDIINGMKK